MIKNRRQHRAALVRQEALLASLAELEGQKGQGDAGLDYEIRGVKGHLHIVETDLSLYENLRSSPPPSVSAAGFVELGDLIVKCRLASGWTNAQIAERLGVATQQYELWESGGFETLTIGKLADLEFALKASFTAHLWLEPRNPAIDVISSAKAENLADLVGAARRARRGAAASAWARELLQQIVQITTVTDDLPSEVVIESYIEFSATARHVGCATDIAREYVDEARRLAADDYWASRACYESARLMQIECADDVEVAEAFSESYNLLVRSCVKNPSQELAWWHYSIAGLSDEARAHVDVPDGIGPQTKHLRLALSLFVEAGDQYGAANCHERLGVALRRKNAELAEKHARTASRIADDRGYARVHLRARVLAAILELARARASGETLEVALAEAEGLGRELSVVYPAAKGALDEAIADATAA